MYYRVFPRQIEWYSFNRTRSIVFEPKGVAMSEREIRNIVRSVCADLDERARRAANARLRKVVLPAALGATLAVSGCASETNSRLPKYDASSPDSAQVLPKEGGAGKEAGEPDAGPVPEYDAPLAGTGGMTPVYGVPIDASAVPEYMATMPDASEDGATGKDAQTVTDAARVDAGPVLEYAAPPPDAGGVPPYMAVIPDAEVQALYMAVIVDSGNQDPDPTPNLLYAAPIPKK